MDMRMSRIIMNCANPVKLGFVLLFICPDRFPDHFFQLKVMLVSLILAERKDQLVCNDSLLRLLAQLLVELTTMNFISFRIQQDGLVSVLVWSVSFDVLYMLLDRLHWVFCGSFT